MIRFLTPFGAGLGFFAVAAAEEPLNSCTESRDACYDQSMHDPNGRTNCESMHRICMRTGRWFDSNINLDYGPRRKR